jgi:hypothetical protein
VPRLSVGVHQELAIARHTPICRALDALQCMIEAQHLLVLLACTRLAVVLQRSLVVLTSAAIARGAPVETTGVCLARAAHQLAGAEPSKQRLAIGRRRLGNSNTCNSR